MVIAKIAVASATYAIDLPYDYLVPKELEGRIQNGMRVLVPFGKGNHSTDGIVLSVLEGKAERELKCITAALDDIPLLDQELLQLALWMRDQYFCTLYDAARAILPAGLWLSLKDICRLNGEIDRENAYQAAGNSQKAKKLIEILLSHGGSMEMGEIRAAFGVSDPGLAIRQLTERGVIIQETRVSKGVGDRTEQIAVLAVSPEEAMEVMGSKRRRAPIQYAVMEQLCAAGQVSVKELCYFTGASQSTLRSLEKQGMIYLEKRTVFPSKMAPETQWGSEPELNAEQQEAYLGLKKLFEMDSASVALLYGVTGSGKTQVYIKLIYSVLKEKKSVLVLVPEIALTPQLVSVFSAHFGNEIAVLHSSLSSRERYDEWKRVRSGEARVVIGTRSAVFAPMQNLGLIILDEEQESSYKSEQTPRYHARDVAKYRCLKHRALLVLGSATPLVESMFLAESGTYHLFCLTHRYNDRTLPLVRIVDMKEELKKGNGRTVSQPLRDAISETVKNGEQVILFLNRRGANRMMICGECGYAPECPRCSVHLTFHSANQRLMCHYCGYSEAVPRICPVCGGIFSYVGAGTQKVEEDLEILFPGIEMIRMDADTVSATRTHDKILKDFQKKNVPVLIGTQMVAKGLDFENVTLVGVIDADQSLFIDDFRASERTFSLLTQVVGRSGRGEKMGGAIIQTFSPNHEVILRAAQQDYDGFYRDEIELRRVRGFPPFLDMFAITAFGLDESEVLQTCQRFRQALLDSMIHPDYREIVFQLLGPAPAPIVKVNDRYRYRLIMCVKNQKKIRELIAHLLRQAQMDKKNRGVSIFVDVNPLS